MVLISDIKVGDTIKIVDDIDTFVQHGASDGMYLYQGCEAVVVSIDLDYYPTVCIDIDNGTDYWEESLIEYVININERSLDVCSDDELDEFMEDLIYG